MAPGALASSLIHLLARGVCSTHKHTAVRGGWHAAGQKPQLRIGILFLDLLWKDLSY